MKLSQIKDIKFGFTSKADGNMSFVFGPQKEVSENRKRLFGKFGLPVDGAFVIKLQHDDAVATVTKETAVTGLESPEAGSPADAAITSVAGVTLFMMIADCMPVLVFDPKNIVIAIIHLGWKGVDLELARKTVEKMSAQFGSKAEDLIICFGPSIKKDSYIKETVSQKDDPRWQPFIQKVSGGFSIDIVGFALSQFLALGVKEENIELSEVDTFKDLNYFSHYRSEKTNEEEGRIAAFVSLN